MYTPTFAQVDFIWLHYWVDTKHVQSIEIVVETLRVGICDIRVKQKISVINETKWDKILLKPNVWDQEKLRWILWTYVKVLDEVCQNLSIFHGINKS